MSSNINSKLVAALRVRCAIYPLLSLTPNQEYQWKWKIAKVYQKTPRLSLPCIGTNLDWRWGLLRERGFKMGLIKWRKWGTHLYNILKDYHYNYIVNNIKCLEHSKIYVIL